MEQLNQNTDTLMVKRFRGFLPVVVDVETGGFDSHQNALLEIAAVILEMDSQGDLQIKESYPLEGVKFVMFLQDDRILMNGELRITPEMETQQTKVDDIDGETEEEECHRKKGCHQCD